MRICAAQIKPVAGNIDQNIKHHLSFIDLADMNGSDLIIFPELSLTGYEPVLAENLATDKEDTRLNIFQDVSDSKKISIGVGIPIKTTTGVTISLVLFQPGKTREIYSKKYIHPDEQKFFVSGQNYTGLINQQSNIALAICYELSIAQHAEAASKRGSDIYIASVAKSAEGVENATRQLSYIAKKYSLMTIMVNSVGFCDTFESAGLSAVWNRKGKLTGQLDNKNPGLLIYDIATQEVFKKSI